MTISENYHWKPEGCHQLIILKKKSFLHTQLFYALFILKLDGNDNLLSSY